MWVSIIFQLILYFFTCHGFSKTTSHEYQFLKRNTESQTTHYGFVSHPYIIKENEYLSYRDDQGNNILISNFGGKEYECFGSCFCEYSERTTSTNIISKRIFSYLFVSLSAIVAFEKAKKYFESKCLEELSNECQKSSIKSNVEKCSTIQKEERKNQEKEEKRRIFTCYGNCVEPKKKTNYFKKFECEKLKKEGEVVVYESDVIVHINNEDISAIIFQRAARSKFQESFLTDFCKENSKKVEQLEQQTTTQKNKIVKRTFSGYSYGCVSSSDDGKNIRCRLIDPEPTNTNWKWRRDKFNREKEQWNLT